MMRSRVGCGIAGDSVCVLLASNLETIDPVSPVLPCGYPCLLWQVPLLETWLANAACPSTRASASNAQCAQVHAPLAPQTSGERSEAAPRVTGLCPRPGRTAAAAASASSRFIVVCRNLPGTNTASPPARCVH